MAGEYDEASVAADGSTDPGKDSGKLTPEGSVVVGDSAEVSDYAWVTAVVEDVGSAEVSESGYSTRADYG